MNAHKIDTLDLAIHLLEDERKTNLGYRKYLVEKTRQKLRKSKDISKSTGAIASLRKQKSKSSLKQNDRSESGYNTNRSEDFAKQDSLDISSEIFDRTDDKPKLQETERSKLSLKRNFSVGKLSTKSAISSITQRSYSLITENITPVRTPSPTVSEFQCDSFDQFRCARLLFKLKRGVDCVDDVLLDALAIRSYKERSSVIAAFKSLFDLELEPWLISWVKPDFHCLIRALTVSQEKKLAADLNKLLPDPDANVGRIVEMITLHSGITLTELKSAYFEAYDKTLEKALIEVFTEPTALFLTQLCQEDSRGLTQGLGLFGQQGLSDNMKLGELNNDSLKYLTVLANSYQHLKSALNDHYKKNNGNVNSAIFTEAIDTFISCVWSPHSLYVKRIFTNLCTDNEELLETLIARIDMNAICEAFERQHKVKLVDSIAQNYLNEAGLVLINMINYFTKSESRELHQSRFSNMDQYKITMSDAHPAYLDQIVYHTDTKGSKQQQRNMWQFMNEAERSKYMEMLSKESDLKQLKQADIDDQTFLETTNSQCGQSQYHINCLDKNCQHTKDKSFWKIPWHTYDRSIGTVRRNPGFVLSHCLEMLRSATDSANEDKFIESWAISTNNRLAVKTEFERQTKSALSDAIHKAFGDPKCQIYQLMFEPPTSLDVWILKETFASGSSIALETVLIVLECRTPQEIKTIESRYIELHGTQLINEIKLIADGYTYQLLEAMLMKPRDFIGKPVDNQICWSEATRLFKDSKKPLDLNVTLLIEILSQRNKFHIATVAQEYRKITGHSLEVAFKKFSDLNLQYCLESLVKLLLDPLKFFTPLLKKFLGDRNTFRQFLLYIVISRCEVDLLSVLEAYKTEFESDITESFVNSFKEGFSALSVLLSLH